MSGLLATYLEDHLAGAAYAIDLLGALRDQYAGEPLGGFAANMIPEVQADYDVLKELAARIGSGSSGFKGVSA
jgi:hypothetical protein